MKKSLSIITVALVCMLIQGCGSKSKEKSEGAATAEIEAVKTDQPTRAEMRATLEKVMAERAARRKAEYEALILITPFYTDAEGFIVFNKAESNPTFVGGDEAMDKFLKENVVYPTEAKDKGIEGTVFVDFIVASNGKVRAVAVTDAPGEEVDQTLRNEAIRVVTSMPAWVPGRQRGKAVDVKFSVPVSFVMN